MYQPSRQHVWLCTFYVHTMVYPPHIIGWCLEYVSQTSCHHLPMLLLAGTTMVPKEMNYYIPGAQGTTTTCTAQGFLIVVAYIAANLYNCSICLYYLSIIRYNKKDEYIPNKLEPWFHGISIIFPLVLGFIGIAMKAYNEYESVCFMRPNNPPHCIRYENRDTPPEAFFIIPCGRGDGGENPILYLVTWIVSFGSTLSFTPTVIAGTMLLMYRSVSKIEKNMRNYGVSALRLNARSGGGNRGENPGTTNNTTCTNDQRDGVMRRIKRLIMCTIPHCLRHHDHPRPTSRSNRSVHVPENVLSSIWLLVMLWHGLSSRSLS
jgi:hypothetical protein